jgi:hypothetical protein
VIQEMADDLASVAGVVGVTLGGSRARGTHVDGSDVDLGVYYRPPLDVDAVRALVARWSDGDRADVCAPGGWGAWVDGGAWLSHDGTFVDWIYRDVDRVAEVGEAAAEGRYEVAHHVGHPLGFYSCAYAGELALGRVLTDPTGCLTGLADRLRPYPDALGDALSGAVWEAGFTLDVARKAVPRGDAAYLAGCLFRAVGVMAQALHGRARRWVVNEKGLVTSAGALDGAPADFAGRAHALLGGVGTRPDALAATLDEARALARAVESALG